MTSASASILAPHVEAQLSVRARRVLARPTTHRNASRYRSREDLAAAIRGYGSSPTEAILDFEEQFGGLEISSTPFSLKLGISLPQPGAARVDEDESSEAPDPRALGLLPCGSYGNGTYDLWVDDRGAIHAAYTRLWKLSASPVKLLEKVAAQEMLGGYEFVVRVRPPMAPALAAALNLSRLDPPSDVCETWWEGESLAALQAHLPDDARSDTTFVSARRVDDVVRVLLAASTLDGSARFSLSAGATQNETLPGDGPSLADIAAMMAPEPEALRFDYDGGQQSTGEIWVLGPPGSHRIEQYRVYEGRVRGWVSLRDGGSTARAWSAKKRQVPK
jgi:hypothetical protein